MALRNTTDVTINTTPTTMAGKYITFKVDIRVKPRITFTALLALYQETARLPELRLFFTMTKTVL